MNKADVLFLDIYMSIRGSWAGGIINRGKVLLKIIPLTTLPEELKIYFKEHFEDMNKEFGDEWFDGRSWARDCINSYDDLMKMDWYDEDFYKEQSLYEQSSEVFFDRFPTFDANDYMLNHIMPQMRGGEPNKKELDNHPSYKIDRTAQAINEFLDAVVLEGET